MRAGIGRVLAGAILAAVALLSMLSPLTGLLTVAQPQTPPNAGNRPAEIYVERVSRFVNFTLQLAENYNITLNASLKVRVNTTMQLLDWARANLSENVTLAVILATRASINFAPVAEYIWSNLPGDVKKEIEIQHEERAIQARERILENLRERVLTIQNLTGANMTDLLNAINATLNMLQEAEQALQAGNLTYAKRLIHQATIRIVVEVRHSTISAYHAVRKSMTISILTMHLVRHVEHLEEAINSTINMINNTNNTEANETENITLRVTGLLNFNTQLLNMAQRLISEYPYTNPNDTIYQALIIISQGLNTSKGYLEQALQAAEANDTLGVISNLTLAYETLNATLTQIQQLGLPGEVRILVHKELATLHGIHHMERNMIDRTYASISRMLDRKMTQLQRIYEKYENGKMPAWRVRLIFTNEKTQLELLKSQLPATAPDWLIQKIDSIINWINTHMP
jgi:hypothetical protein